MVEVESSKKTIKLNVPIQIGFFVLEYAKLLLLSFYYDFLLKFLPLDSFCLIESDTDSLYLALSEKSLFLTVPVNKRAEFANEYDNWFAKEYCDQHKDAFFRSAFNSGPWEPENCCRIASKYHSRTVGFFHQEFKGSAILALCSKCYYCAGESVRKSAKGVSRNHNALTANDYREVLLNQTKHKATNKGFRITPNGIFTYTQVKKGLSYMYGKRIVCADHVTTLPTRL